MAGPIKKVEKQEDLVRKMLQLAPENFDRLPGGMLDVHEAAVNELASRGLVEIRQIPGRSPAGEYQMSQWRRTGRKYTPA